MTTEQTLAYQTLDPAARYLLWVMTALGGSEWQQLDIADLSRKMNITRVTFRNMLDRLCAAGLAEQRQVVVDGSLRRTARTLVADTVKLPVV